MKNQKILIVCLVIIILASIITGIYLITNKEEGEPEFKIEGIDPVENQEVLADETVEGLKITNVSLFTRDGISSFKAEVTNTTDNEVNINTLYVIFHEDTNEIKVPALQNIELSANKSTYINITSEDDLSKTTKIEYSLEN